MLANAFDGVHLLIANFFLFRIIPALIVSGVEPA